MKSLKGSPNKFIHHLSQDILAENHSLKQQLIKVRKQLKDYEFYMVESLIKASEQIKIPKPAFLFDDPRQCLQCFIRVLSQKIEGDLIMHSRLQQFEQKYSKTQRKICEVKSENQELKEKFQREATSKKQIQKNEAHLKKQIEILLFNTSVNQKKYLSQIANLQKINQKIVKQCDIKMLTEKKSYLEKHNKQMSRYRLQMDSQIYQKQKQMKFQIDKKDREAKTLLQYINSLVKINQQKPKINYRSKCSDKQSKPQITPEIAELLAQIVRPFSDHTQLNKKISNFNQERVELQNNIRKLTTNNLILTTKETQNESQISLLKYRIQSLKQEIESAKQNEFKAIKNSEQCTNQMKNIEKYYESRWNTEMDRVIHHLDKQYAEKEKALDNQYNSLKEQLAIERQNVREQITKNREETERVTKQFKQLTEDLKRQKECNAKNNAKISQLNNAFRQFQKIHKEQIFSVRLSYNNKLSNLSQNLYQKQQQIKKTQYQLTHVNEIKNRQVEKIKEELEKELLKKIQQEKCKIKDDLQFKQRQIAKLSIQVQRLKTHIRVAKLEEAEKIIRLTQRFQKQKEKQFSKIKIDHYQEINNMKDKIFQLEEKLDDLKNVLKSKVQQFEKEKLFLSNCVKDKQRRVDQLKQTLIEKEVYLQKNTEKQEELSIEIKFMKQKYESYRIQLQSCKLLLKNKQNQIDNLLNEKNHWYKQIQNCKKEFKNGFKQLKLINERKISFYKSRIWQLEVLAESGMSSQKDIQAIKCLTESNQKLQTEITLKQAENYALQQVKAYYEVKDREANAKLMINYELKSHQSIFVRKNNRKSVLNPKIKEQIIQDLSGFTGKQSYKISQYKGNKNRSSSAIRKQIKNYKTIKSYSFRNEKHDRTHSSLV